jgi:hypothetical protein
VKITFTVKEGSTERAPSRKELMLRRTAGIGLAAMKPSLRVLDTFAAATPQT